MVSHPGSRRFHLRLKAAVRFQMQSQNRKMKRVSFIFGGYAYTKQQNWDVE